MTRQRRSIHAGMKVGGTALILWASSAASAPAQFPGIELPPGAVVVQSGDATQGRHEIAIGPWQSGTLPKREITGSVQATTWQIPASDTATIESIASAFETGLASGSYEIVLSCRDRSCGGFDFRHGLDMGRSPEMHVDIGNFRYLSAMRPDGASAAAVTVSRGGETLYLHLVQIGAAQDPPLPVARSGSAQETGAGGAAAAPPGDAARDGGSLIATLLGRGSVALDDLNFRTGASELSDRDYASLRDLANFLDEDPARRVMLVGHTDSEGGRDANLVLSRERAEAVRRHLVDDLGVRAEQLQSAGIGFLAPRATNATPEGRQDNRRVEVVLLNAG